MAKIFINLPETKLKFHLFDKDIDSKMSSKLRNLGLADISILYPSNPSDVFAKEANGVYRQGEFACDSVSIISATDGATFSTTFNPEDNTVDIVLMGRFFCGNVFEDAESFKLIDKVHEKTEGFIWCTRLTDNKGKIIKKPKDEYGISSPLIALVEKETYDNAAWRVDFKAFIEDDLDI